MEGREDKKSNDLFYVCSLIAYIARKNKRKPRDIVNLIGLDNLDKIYDLADVYHSDNIDRVCDDFSNECKISMGNFDNVAQCEYSIPTHWDIGKVYKRLILMVSEFNQEDVILTLEKVYNSFISDLIEDYNSSFYYDNPKSIFATYLNGDVIKED